MARPSRFRGVLLAASAALSLAAVAAAVVLLLVATGAVTAGDAQGPASGSIDVSLASDSTGGEGIPSVEAGGYVAHDWASLLETNGDVVGWITVAGTPVDYPMMHCDDQQYYLKHDLYGNYDIYGEPFIDARESPSSRHLLSYGHHVTGSERMYSTLYRAWSQSTFDGIGDLTYEWRDEDGAVWAETFSPAFAQRVDQSYQPIQRFDDFADDAEFSSWLSGMLSGAGARSDDAEALCSSARRAITLCTCASDVPNQPERTLVTFVSTEPARLVIPPAGA